MAVQTRDDFIKRTNYMEKSIKNIKTIVSSANKYQINDFDFEEVEGIIDSIETSLKKLQATVKELD